MGYWKDYEDGRTGNPLGNPLSSGYIQGEQDRRRQEWQRNNDGGGNGGDGGKGCGFVILFVVAIFNLHLIVPAFISTAIQAFVMSKFGDKLFLFSELPTFKKSFRILMFTYLWYLGISLVIGIGGLVFFNSSSFSLENMTSYTELFLNFYKEMFLWQVINLLIVSFIFQRYTLKILDSEISFWRAMLFMVFGLIVWFVVASLVFFIISSVLILFN